MNGNDRKAMLMDLSIRSKSTTNADAGHLAQSGTAIIQHTRLSSDSQPEQEASNQLRAPDRQIAGPSDSLETRSAAAPQGPTSTTRAVASDTPRLSFRAESMELHPDPKHPHARDMSKVIREFDNNFDGDNDRMIGQCNGQA